MLFYTTYIIKNIKTLIKVKKNKKHIEYNNPLKSIVVRSLAEQHLITKSRQAKKKRFSFD